MSEQFKKQRKLDPAYWIVHDNPFGKKVYLYQDPNKSTIIPTQEQIHEFEDNREAKISQNVKQAVNLFNLHQKPPTNLTKAQKEYDKKKLKEDQISFKKTKTAIHHDTVPSIVCDEVFTECYNCIDKNHELNQVKQQKISLSRQYRQKIQLLLKHISKLQKANIELVQQNQRLKQKCSSQKNPEENYECIDKYLSQQPKKVAQSIISQQTRPSNNMSPTKEAKLQTSRVIYSSEISEPSSLQYFTITSSEDDERLRSFDVDQL